MRQLTYIQAIAEAMDQEMARDPNVILLGEDVGAHGGAFQASKGLYQKYGPERVRDTAISEAAIIGAGVGAAMTGLRPICEIMYIDFIGLGLDQIVNQAAKARYMFGGKIKVPLTVRTQGGSGKGNAAQHSQSLEAWLTHIPGLKVAMPSTPHDVKGLLKTAIRDDDPCIVVEHKLLYFQKGDVPEDDYTLPFGRADIKRPGKDVTIVAWSMMVRRSLEAAETLAAEGIDCEVIDPMTLFPLDEQAILESVGKTGRLLIVHEAVRRGGYGGEIAALVAEKGFDLLDAPIVRLGGAPVPIPYCEPLERAAVPSAERIAEAARKLVRYEI